MKNTIRVRQNRVNKHSISQGKKPSILGQTDTTSGHIKEKVKFKPTVATVASGLEFGLCTEEIKALAALAAWEGHTPLAYCRMAVLSYMAASIDQADIQAREGTNPEEIEDAKRLLLSLPPMFRRATAAPGPAAETANAANDHRTFKALTELEMAVDQSSALAELVLNSLSHDEIGAFRRENGALASGVQSLTYRTQNRLRTAFYNTFVATRSSRLP